MVVDCKFIDCQVESEDKELCHCYYFKPLSSFRTVQVDNLDYESCHFDNCTTIAGALGSEGNSEIIGGFVSEVD